MTDTTKGMLLGLVGVAMFGLTLPATRISVAEFPAVFASLGRAVVAAGLAGALLLATRSPLPRGGQWLRLGVVGAGVVLGFPFFSATAMQTVPASHGGVVLGILPLATAAAGVLFARERPSPAFWAWGAAGAALVSGFALLDGGMALAWGDLMLVCAVVSAATGYALSGRLASELGGWQVIAWALVLMLPLVLVPVVPVLGRLDWGASPAAWGAFAYTAVFSQFLGFFFWNRGMALGGVARVGQVQLLQIFVTLIGSAVLLGETIAPYTIGFALAVAATVWMGRRTQIARR